MTDVFIYLIEAQNGLVKIGCGQKPAVRLTAIRTHSPIPARLIATWWVKSAKIERDLHEQFHAQRNHSEWFRPEGEFKAFVESRRGLGLSRIEEWHEITYPDCLEKRKLAGQKRSVKLKALWADPAFREAKAAWRKKLKLARQRREKQRVAA